MNLLEIQNVSKSYGDFRALSNISFSIEEGSVYGLLGPNGAGKTTLIRIINHITAPDEGYVMFDGHRLVENDTASIGYLPEERGLYKKMKVGEQALFFAMLKGLSKGEATMRLQHWFEKFGIASWWNRPVEELSKGMAQKVQFIVTVLHRPKLLIFDEPFSGFDPINAQLLRDEILELKNEGSTIIFSTHNMASVEEICDNITLINHGHNILTGNVDELRRKHSAGRFSFRFRGDIDKFLEPLQPLLLENEIKLLPEGIVEAAVHLCDGVDLRRVIAIVNEAVELRGVEEKIASMNDIFITTVGESNRNIQ